jgi:hypothetical protein
MPDDPLPLRRGVPAIEFDGNASEIAISCASDQFLFPLGSPVSLTGQ